MPATTEQIKLLHQVGPCLCKKALLSASLLRLIFQQSHLQRATARFPQCGGTAALLVHPQVDHASSMRGSSRTHSRSLDL